MNNPTMSDVTFLVEGRKFHCHRIALLASSDTFKCMFDGHYREKEASVIPIPNFSYAIFEAMMQCIYTGQAPAFSKRILEQNIESFFRLQIGSIAGVSRLSGATVYL